ncbi:hypothetical protein FIV42_29085 [Persicimonas caeni]|uniref:DUF3352 domain-containing protein n=1 Tax=Persicimonas caeni TaxID=2292766 RepID=A0A4Y6Q2I1_PERCE|nr:hypothetical protein [Persicimonas caeni]QDG54650.1 hypothetical protein FIV42_29085 [Persicimonas caeni]
MTRYLPSSSQLVVGLNVSKLSQSKYYKEALAWARANSGSDQEFLEVLEKDAKLDLTKDLDAIALSVPDTQVDSSKPQRNFTVAVSGSFDNDKLLAAIKKENKELKSTKKGKATVYSSGEFEFTFPKKGVLWVTAGPDAYRKGAFKALGGGKHSVQANKVFKKLMGEVNTSQGFWMMGDTSTMQTQQTAGSPQPKSIAVSADIAKGLALELLADMPSEADAKSAVEQMKALKQQGGQAAMLSILGAGPLVANLTTKQDGTKLRATTTMTATEFDTMVQRIKQLAQSQMQGGGMPAQPVPNKKNKSGGANADFN